jgi:apolipoprotein N-acyltransferase
MPATPGRSSPLSRVGRPGGPFTIRAKCSAAGGATAGIALGLATALLYAAAYPPLELAALAWLALVPLFAGFLRLPPLAAAAAGLAFGSAGTLAIGWWLPGMLERYFEVPPGAAWAAFVAAAVIIDGVPYALLGALASAAARRGRPPGALVLGAGFVLAEWLRASGPVANPFALFAYSQHGTAFGQLADLAGTWGIGWLLASANAALAGMLVAMPAARPRAALRLAAAGAAAGAAFAYGAYRLAEPADPAAQVRVAVVQTGIERDRHGNELAARERLEHTLALTRAAAAQRPGLVFWPEHAVDFTLEAKTPERAALQRAVDALGVELVLGAARQDGARWHNSVYLLGPQGRRAHSDKVRLVPFAEYGPFGPRLRASTALYQPGTPAPLVAQAASVGAFLCGESLHPDVARGLVAAGADLLANPSIDTWLQAPAAARALLQIAAFRAIETRRAVVRATPTGYSAVIDPWGRSVALSRFGGPDLLVAAVPRETRLTLYQRTGDAAGFAALAVVAAHSLAAGLTGRRRRALA